MPAAGRKRDPIWNCFHDLPAGGKKAWDVEQSVKTGFERFCGTNEGS